VRRLARVPRILSGRRLHFLGARRGPSAIRPHCNRPHSLYRLQEVPEQGSGRLLPRWLPLGRHRDGGYCRGGKGSRADGDLAAIGASSIMASRHPALMISLCAACHAIVERLQVLDVWLPPQLVILWREQHPTSNISCTCPSIHSSSRRPASLPSIPT